MDVNSKHDRDGRKRQSYYARVQDWGEDLERRQLLSHRVAWLVAAIAVGIALLEALALAMLAPLKETTPYLVMVDRTTGFTQVLKGADRSTLNADWALTQSLLAQYVTSREGFDIATVQADYRKVALWSGDGVRKAYLASMEASNPESPFRRLPRTGLETVTVKSISVLGPGTALVRFDTEQASRGQQGGLLQSWAAVVRYRFVNASMQFSDRLINPVGFQVTSYRKDAETLPVQQTAPAPIVQALPAPQQAMVRENTTNGAAQ